MILLRSFRYFKYPGIWDYNLSYLDIRLAFPVFIYILNDVAMVGYIR